MIVDQFYDLCTQAADYEDFGTVDAIVTKVDVERLTRPVAVALLMATYPLRASIAGRLDLFRRVEVRLIRERSGEEAANVLSGLR